MSVVSFIAGTRSHQIMAYIGPVFGIRTSAESIDLSSAENTFRNLVANFDGDVDKEKLIEGASRGLVAAAGDPHTVFFSAEEAEEFENSLSGKISGIGAEIGVRSGQPTILRLLDDSPAKSSGLKAGDVIVAVNDDSTRNFDAAKTAELIRGDEGTTVKITVTRSGERKEFSIVRAQVTDPSVAWSIENNVGILKIRRFDYDTGELSQKAAKEFKSANVKGVIVDLRDNGGGLLDQVAPVAGIWLKDQVVVREYRSGEEVDTLSSSGDPILDGVKTVLLTNSGTASASEIIAGAFKDYKTATLIGETTYGKGTVQQQLDLGGGRMLKVTIEHWYTPNKASIDQKGVTPDKKIELSIEDVDSGKDPQMDAAKQQLQ